MTVTGGFYDSLAGDRTYNAAQMGEMFEGLITEGIFGTVGGSLLVTSESGMNVSVDTGRAWLKNTWTKNDDVLILAVPASEVALNRIDTVVVEINKETATRANTIKIIEGTPASTPVAPTLVNTANIGQYPLANIAVAAGITTITAPMITNRVGVEGGTPLVTGIVDVIDVSELLTQFQAEFDEWFDNLVDQLDGVQVTNLQNQINALDTRVEDLELAMDDFDFQEIIDLLTTSPVGTMYNAKIQVTVSSSNLTVALKTYAGTDPSPTDKVYVRFPSEVRSIESALSVTKNAGTNYGNAGAIELTTKEVDWFVYLAWNTTPGTDVMDIGFSRMPYFDIGSQVSNTSTDQNFFAHANASNLASSDELVNIARFAATLTATGGYLWSVPSFNALNLKQKPTYETRILDCHSSKTPSAGTMSSIVVSYEKYQIKGREFTFHIGTAWTQNTSNADYVQFTLPVSPAIPINFAGIMVGAGTPVASNVTGSGNSVYVRRYDGASAVFTTGAGKDVRMSYTSALVTT